MHSGHRVLFVRLMPLVLAWGSAVQADMILAQHDYFASDGGISLDVPAPDKYSAQSLNADQTGEAAYVELTLQSVVQNNPTHAPVSVEIWQVGFSFGLTDYPVLTGAPLASGSLACDSAEFGSSIQWVRVDLQNPAMLYAGQSYALVLKSQAASGAYKWQGRRAYAGGTSFSYFTGNGGYYNYYNENDNGFRVSTPEPGAALLLLACSPGAFARR